MITTDVTILVTSISSHSEVRQSYYNDCSVLHWVLLSTPYADVDVGCAHYALCTHFSVLELFANDKHTHISAEW